MPEEVRDNEREETPEWAQKLQTAMENLTDKLTTVPTQEQESETVVEVPIPPTPEETEVEQEVEVEQEQEVEKPKKMNFLNWLL